MFCKIFYFILSSSHEVNNPITTSGKSTGCWQQLHTLLTFVCILFSPEIKRPVGRKISLCKINFIIQKSKLKRTCRDDIRRQYNNLFHNHNHMLKIRCSIIPFKWYGNNFLNSHAHQLSHIRVYVSKISRVNTIAILITLQKHNSSCFAKFSGPHISRLSYVKSVDYEQLPKIWPKYRKRLRKVGEFRELGQLW